MMDAFLDALAVLHLLRPWALLGVPIVVLIWGLTRRKARASGSSPTGIAPHLAKALTVGDHGRGRWLPIDSAGLVLVLLLVAASGPTWSRVPNPFLSQTAPLMVLLEVTRSMQAPDLQPSRLERAKFKIMDLVEARAGARTGLVAYAGTAHRVAPLTEDPEILRVMLAGLSPDIMPSEGDNAAAALELARAELAKSDTFGAILLVTDGIAGSDVAAMSVADGDAPVIVLFAAPESTPLGPLEGTGAATVRLSADDSDIGWIERQAASAYRAALLGDERLDWEDKGWVLAWPAALILLLWFRRGWTMRWSVNRTGRLTLILVAFGLTSLPAAQARAGVTDWFFTPDQQGMMAYRDKDYARAAQTFGDPMWRAQALMKGGKYPGAGDIFSRIDTPEAAFAEAYARIRNREYRPAIAAYERALELRPDFPEATRNLEVTRTILEYVETAREQSDTGEDSGLGADDVVFDNEADRGADTQTDFSQEEKPQFSTAEQWMRSVDTNMGDFLKARFRLEAAGGGE